MESPGDDVIDLNVGGLRMTTTRKTLCQIKVSLLANLFNCPQRLARLPRDKDGFIFLDYNPKNFALILDYLRLKKISTVENPAPLPKVHTNEMKSFKHLAEHLGLRDEFFPIIPESFETHCSEMGVIQGDTVFLRHNNHVTAFTFGKYIYDSGVFRLKLELHRHGHNNSSDLVDVGVINGDLETSQFRPIGLSFHESTFPMLFGYGVGRNNIKIYEKKENTYSCVGFGNGVNYNQFFYKNGDIIELLLDCDAAMLYLNTPTGEQCQVELPKWTKYRLFVRLNDSNSKLSILEVSKEW